MHTLKVMSHKWIRYDSSRGAVEFVVLISSIIIERRARSLLPVIVYMYTNTLWSKAGTKPTIQSISTLNVDFS